MPLLVYAMAVWQAPVAIPLWLLVVLPLLAFRQLRFDGWAWYRGWLPYAVFRAPRESVVVKVVWRGMFVGAALPYCVFVTSDAHPRCLQHEARHVWQWAVFGPVFLPLYAVLLLLCGYLENPFEIDAYSYAQGSRG